jgi:hypothetical protein
MNPDSQVSSHFIVSRSGEITQMLDTDVTAWTQADGNGKWLSVENEGYLPDPLTDAQVNANAEIFARSAQEYGHPLVVANSPYDRGLGHHSMGAENGVNWGHSECPGDSIKAQKPEIVERAKGNDVSASEVWSWDVDPSGGKYSASGSLWTTLSRTDYLANDFAPATRQALTDMSVDIAAIESDLEGMRSRVATLQNGVADLGYELAAQTELAESQQHMLKDMRWINVLTIILLVLAIAGGLGAWAIAG